MAVATSDDVAVALGRPITLQTEQQQVEWWLDGIELIIGYRLGDVTLLDQGLLKFVEVEAVVGKVRRSDSRVTSRTVSIDDGSVTDRFETSASVSDITDEWWSFLNPDVASSAYSTRPGFDADDVSWSVATPPGYDPAWLRLP